MPLDDERNTLVPTFVGTQDEPDKPQVFELIFDRQDESVQWSIQAKREAKKLGIEYQEAGGLGLKIDLPYQEAQKHLYLAMNSSADYVRLTEAVKAHFDLDLTVDERYAQFIEDNLDDYTTDLEGYQAQQESESARGLSVTDDYAEHMLGTFGYEAFTR